MDKTHYIAYFNALAATRERWKKRNWPYHRALKDLARFVIPERSLVLEIGSDTGDLLAALAPSRGVGVDCSPKMIEIARKKYPGLDWRLDDAEALAVDEKFDYVVLSDLIGYADDIERVFTNLNRVCHAGTRVLITHYNYFWEPMLRLGEWLGLKAKQPLQNWVSDKDVENILYLAGFEVIKKGNRLLFPFHIPFLSSVVNRFFGNLPLIRSLGLIQYYVARPMPKGAREYSVSIVIPCRNEEGNIEDAIKRLPQFGLSQEVIFVEGHSADGTLEEVKRVAAGKDAPSVQGASSPSIRWAVQPGKGKGDAVRKGFAMATGEVLMILDADLTVAPEDLPKFYQAMRSGRVEFINGSRLVYPLEKQAMRFFNILGNKFFSTVFTWLLGQRIKDTLCGTKVLFKKDYEKIAKGRGYFGDFDPFGDFDLLFGAAKLNLKIVELPVRYHVRMYGATNIQRWRHGWLLLQMVVFAMKKMKFI